ncbi:MAG: SAM-dependent methyltransferase, partial [Mycobacteriales bacterium]
FIPDEQAPWELLSRYRQVLAPGSTVALSHCTLEGMPGEWADLEEVYKSSSMPVYPRSKAELERFFVGAAMVEPGIVDAVAWRPDKGEQETERSGFYAAAEQL